MDLTYIMFTKHLEGLDVPCIIDAENAASLALAAKVGFQIRVHTHYKGAPIVLMERARPDGGTARAATSST